MAQKGIKRGEMVDAIKSITAQQEGNVLVEEICPDSQAQNMLMEEIIGESDKKINGEQEESGSEEEDEDDDDVEEEEEEEGEDEEEDEEMEDDPEPEQEEQQQQPQDDTRRKTRLQTRKAEGNQKDWVYINVESLKEESSNEEDNDGEDGKIIKCCALCMKDYPISMLKNGHHIQGPASKVPLSKVLVVTLKMSLQLSAFAWKICLKCIRKLQHADVKMKEAAKLTADLAKVKEDISTIAEDLRGMLSTRLTTMRIDNSKESLLRDGPSKPQNKSILLKESAIIKPEPDKPKRPNYTHLRLTHPSPLTHPLKEEQKNEKITCPLCQKSMRKKSIRRHVRNQHKKDMPIICVKCVIKIRTEAEFAVHMLGAHPDKPIEEIAYDKDLESAITKRKGRKTKKWTSPKVTCPICNATTTKHYLKHHINRHERKYIYKCKFCHEMFMTRTQRTVHLRRVHGAPEPVRKIYHCKFCGRDFNWRGNYLKHLKLIHSNKFDYKCEYCDKMFKIKEKLVVHRRHHTDERPYMCKICNHRFLRSSACRKHIKRVHKMEITQLRLNNPTHQDLLPMMRVDMHDQNNIPHQLPPPPQPQLPTLPPPPQQPIVTHGPTITTHVNHFHQVQEIVHTHAQQYEPQGLYIPNHQVIYH